MENFLALAITTWIFKWSVLILNFVVMWGILNNIITFQYQFSFLKMNILWTHAVFKVVEPDSRSTQSDSKSMARTISSQGETTTESRLRFSLEDSSSQVTNAFKSELSFLNVNVKLYVVWWPIPIFIRFVGTFLFWNIVLVSSLFTYIIIVEKIIILSSVYVNPWHMVIEWFFQVFTSARQSKDRDISQEKGS